MRVNLDRPTMRDGGRLTFAELLAAGASPVGLEQLRLDRLFELRAVIESLRSEHSRVVPLAPCAARNRDRP